jgi:hypothetical protein
MLINISFKDIANKNIIVLWLGKKNGKYLIIITIFYTII